MPPSPRINQLGFSTSTDLVKVVHQPGCLDPNCLLPSCINIKMQRSHLQTCTKTPGTCDVCKQLKSSAKKAVLPFSLRGSPSTQPTSWKDEEDDEVTIIEVTPNIARDNPKMNQQISTMKTMNSDTAYNNLKNLQQVSYDSVTRQDKAAVRYGFSNQAQMRPGTFQFSNFNSLNTSSQAFQPPLEVLCNTLQALNTFIRLASSSQLELQVIPLLEQALADMKVTARKRLDLEGGISPMPVPRNSSVVMEYCDTDACIPDNQWLRVQPPPPPPPPPVSPPFPSSTLQSTSPMSSSVSLATAWELPSSTVKSSTTLLSHGEESTYGDAENDESQFDLQDIILLDFVDELLG